MNRKEVAKPGRRFMVAAMNTYLIYTADGKCAGQVKGSELNSGDTWIAVYNEKNEVVAIFPSAGFAVVLKS